MLFCIITSRQHPLSHSLENYARRKNISFQTGIMYINAMERFVELGLFSRSLSRVFSFVWSHLSSVLRSFQWLSNLPCLSLRWYVSRVQTISHILGGKWVILKLQTGPWFEFRPACSCLISQLTHHIIRKYTPLLDILFHQFQSSLDIPRHA